VDVVESAVREIVLVVLVALAGLVLAGAATLAPWHAAQAGTIVEVHPPAWP
jgi:hypothetical protein